jgi:ABC-type spermidine/putrescine transport system permease subunit II
VPLLTLLALAVVFAESRLVPERVASLRRLVGSDARSDSTGRARAARDACSREPLGSSRCRSEPSHATRSLPAYSPKPGSARDAALRSLAWAVIGACVLTLLGLALGYLVERRVFPWSRGVDQLSLLLFAMPSTVLGIGLVALWNHQATSWIYSTPAIVLIGYVGQLAAVSSRLCANAVAAVPVRLEEAAQIAGARWPRRVLRIVAPLVAPGLVAGWLASFLFCLRDLGISMIVYPPGHDPLLSARSLDGERQTGVVAALCTMESSPRWDPALLAWSFEEDSMTSIAWIGVQRFGNRSRSNASVAVAPASASL